MPSVGELAHLAKHPEPDGTNLSRYLLEHFDRLREFVPSRLSKVDLVGMPDQDLAPLVSRSVKNRRTLQAEHRFELARARAIEASARLSSSPSRTDRRILLDPALLLGSLLADPSTEVIVIRRESELFFRQWRLRRIARVLASKNDLAVWVDDLGLHLRWNAGRGGLNVLPDPPPPRSVQLLVVDLRAAHLEVHLQQEAPCPGEHETQKPPASITAPQTASLEEGVGASNCATSPPTRRRRPTWVDFLTFI